MNTQVNVKIDRDKAAAVGVNASQIENALYDAYGPRWVSTIYSSINEYKVLLELKPQYQLVVSREGHLDKLEVLVELRAGMALAACGDNADGDDRQGGDTTTDVRTSEAFRQSAANLTDAERVWSSPIWYTPPK